MRKEVFSTLNDMSILRTSRYCCHLPAHLQSSALVCACEQRNFIKVDFPDPSFPEMWKIGDVDASDDSHPTNFSWALSCICSDGSLTCTLGTYQPVVTHLCCIAQD
jgi:hypothetical protein